MVSHQSWFGGVYQDPANFFAQMVVEPEPFMQIYPEFIISDEHKKAWAADRQGAIVVRERQGDVFLLRALRVPEGPVVFAEYRTEGGGSRSVPLVDVSLPQQRFHLVEHLHASQATTFSRLPPS